MPSTSTSFIRFVSDEFDLDATGTHDLGTSFSTGQQFHPIGAQIVITDRAGTLLTPAICSFGTNSSSYDDLVTAQLAGGVLDELADVPLNSDCERVDYNTTMKVKVNTAATGTGLTLKAKAIIYGFYQ